MTPELQALRRAVERDRYGLMAQALVARDHCTLSECPAFRVITDTHQIVANMDERMYDGLVSRYAPSWNAPAAAGGSGRGPCAIDAHRQTHQCRVSHRSLDPAGQHHDAGAGLGRDATRAARSGFRCQRLIAHPDDGPGAGSGQEADQNPGDTPTPPAPVQIAPAAPPPPAASND